MPVLRRGLMVMMGLALGWIACTCKQPAPAGSPETQGKPSAAVAQPASGTPSIPAPTSGTYNAAFVYVGPVGDGGWTYAHDQGRRVLEKELGVHTVFIESVAEGAEAEQVIRGLARKGFDLVVATSFGYMDAVEAVASEFPRVKFVHISGHKSNERNFGNLFGAMESMKYLAGLIAGARAHADGKTRLGYIAPFPIPEVVRLGNALMLGIRTSCPTCTLEIRWINSWFDPTKEREAAESLLKDGVQVVVTGADTSGPIVAAKDAGRFAVGYDSENACQVAPSHCLTTPYWSWGPVYVKLVRDIQAGAWKGGSSYLDVDAGIVGLYGFMPGQTPSEAVPADVVPKVKELLAQMQQGKFTRFDLFRGPIKDNQGRVVIPEGKALSQLDLEGLPGCTICMNWLAEGIVGQIPRR